jgi:TPR repeat protein
MLKSLTKRGWRDHVASLRKKTSAGDVSAVTELGLTFLEGIQGRNGQSIVRRNSRAAVALLHQAATSGDTAAASSLGYAYDIGLGTKPSIKEAIRWYQRAARGGSSIAATNLATIHRDSGNSRLAFQLWKRSEKMRDGATPLSILATAISTVLAQKRTPRMQSACSDAQSRPETFPDMAAKRRCTTSLFNS